jgi:NAD(P)-dependent dehydrogenase (short-subunit alcohol dehydrogenase family)
MSSFLVTGASRGLGLAFVQRLSALPVSEVSIVFATARSQSPELEELAKQSAGRVIVIKLEVTNETSIKQAATEVEDRLGGKGLDVLINNAGVCDYTPDGVKTL